MGSFLALLIAVGLSLLMFGEPGVYRHAWSHYNGLSHRVFERAVFLIRVR